MDLSPFFLPSQMGKTIKLSSGDEVTFKATTEETGGAYTLLHRVVIPGHGPRKHFHTKEEEAFYVLEGEFSFEVGDQFFKGEKGSFIFGPRKIPHKYWNSGAKAGQLLIFLSPGGMDHFYVEFYKALEEAPGDKERQTKIAEKYGIFFVDEIEKQTFVD